MSTNKNILVIDDDETIIELIDISLSKNDMNVLSAGCVDDAVTLFEENISIIDAVILDRQMPNCDGNEFLMKLRNEFKSTIPVMMLTGKNGASDIVSSLKLGATEYIIKPFDLDDFIIRFKRMIGYA